MWLISECITHAQKFTNWEGIGQQGPADLQLWGGARTSALRSSPVCVNIPSLTEEQRARDSQICLSPLMCIFFMEKADSQRHRDRALPPASSLPRCPQESSLGRPKLELNLCHQHGWYKLNYLSHDLLFPGCSSAGILHCKQGLQYRYSERWGIPSGIFTAIPQHPPFAHPITQLTSPPSC